MAWARSAGGSNALRLTGSITFQEKTELFVSNYYRTMSRMNHFRTDIEHDPEKSERTQDELGGSPCSDEVMSNCKNVSTSSVSENLQKS